MRTKVLIKRGNYPKNDVILSDGEMAYSKKTREFFVGDGKHVMTELKPFNNIVSGDNGYIYLVRVDKEGKPHAELMRSQINGSIFEFKTSE